MNSYFLVEGKTERKVYPRWISYFIPSLKRVHAPGEVIENNYFLISGGGYPSLLDVHLPNSVADINDSGKYDYFVVVLDADEIPVGARVQEVKDKIAKKGMDLRNCELQIIVQNRCIETWFLGNHIVFSRNPGTSELMECVRFYDVSVDDPELMYKPDSFEETCAGFHFKYLRLMLAERHIRYTKRFPRDVVETHYLEQLERRIEHTPNHMSSLQVLFKFCAMMKQRVGT